MLCDACLQFLSSIKLNGLCLHPIKNYILSHLMVMLNSIFYSASRHYWFFCCLTAVIDFSSTSTAILYSALWPSLTAIKDCLYVCHIPSAWPCLGSLILNGHSLTMNVPHSNILFGLAAVPHSNMLFGLAAAPCGNILFGLAAMPHGSILSALWTHLMVIGKINFFFASRR